jgi:hypothetical protein
MSVDGQKNIVSSGALSLLFCNEKRWMPINKTTMATASCDEFHWPTKTTHLTQIMGKWRNLHILTSAYSQETEEDQESFYYHGNRTNIIPIDISKSEVPRLS